MICIHTAPTTAPGNNRSTTAIFLGNIQTVEEKFASLLNLAEQKLRSVRIDIEDLRLHLIEKFSPADSLDASASGNINAIVGAATNIDAIFHALTTHRLWDYCNYHLLQSIVTRFASTDEELQLRVEQYQRDLTKLLLTTSIKAYLEAVRSNPLTAESKLETPNPGLFSELSFEVDPSVTEHHFQYIDNLRKSLAVQFHLPTPALLFHNITEGCLVNWRVLSNLVPHLRTNVPENASFFDEKQIVKVALFSEQEECLYAVKGKRGAKVSSV